MLECENVHPQLSALIDKELPLWEAQMIKWHMRRCQDCAYEFMLLKDTARMLSSIDNVTTGDNFIQDVMTKASMMSRHDNITTNPFVRFFNRARYYLDWFRYSFRRKVSVYAVALMFLVVWGFFIGVMPTIISPQVDMSTTRVTEARLPSDAIKVEFVTPAMLHQYSRDDLTMSH